MGKLQNIIVAVIYIQFSLRCAVTTKETCERKVFNSISSRSIECGCKSIMSKLSGLFDESQPLDVKETVEVFAFLKSIAFEYPGRVAGVKSISGQTIDGLLIKGLLIEIEVGGVLCASLYTGVIEIVRATISKLLRNLRKILFFGFYFEISISSNLELHISLN